MVQSLSPVAFESVSAVTATNTVELGTRRTVSGNEYVYVYNDGGSDINPGYAAVPAAGTTSYSCTVSATTSADIVFGVCKHTTLTTATYGWLLTRGYVNIETNAASGTVTTGTLIEVGANGDFSPVSNTTGNLSPAVGKALDTIVTGASGSAYVSCY